MNSGRSSVRTRTREEERPRASAAQPNSRPRAKIASMMRLACSRVIMLIRPPAARSESHWSTRAQKARIADYRRLNANMIFPSPPRLRGGEGKGEGALRRGRRRTRNPHPYRQRPREILSRLATHVIIPCPTFLTDRLNEKAPPPTPTDTYP